MAIWNFEIVSELWDIELIARGNGVRERRRLMAQYGGKRWRKLKGKAIVRLVDGTVFTGEVHWFEAQGVGKKEEKVIRNLDND